ncbi:MAG TPA: MFS transporter [Pyrinomonadaceae bacterium]|nr:MFS transporter [Pyrinomonadaceae bacterium]
MNSTWAALRNPAFRKIWIAAVISGTCVAAHDSAATWMMNTLTGSSLLLSLMSTVASLPFFLMTLPAGALADKVNRQKLISIINVCLAATAFSLAVLGWTHLLNPYLILGSVFFMGIGFAINAPAWTSIAPQVVSEAELPSAATLNGLQFNISGIIGPVLGGLLIPFAGANFVFALNAACFLLVVLATRQWKQATVLAKPPSESFFKSFVTIAEYVCNASGFQVVLARSFLFALFISVIPALMPVVGLKALHLSSSDLGLLFTSMGAGSVVGAVFLIPWLRARLLPDYITLLANLLVIVVYVLMALVRQTEIFLIVAALAGVGWTMSASELWVAAQRAMPDSARGRMNATIIMTSQGAMALGGAIWGSAAAIAGASYTLLAAAILLLTCMLLARRLSINFALNVEKRVSGVLSIRVKPKEVMTTLTRESLAA